MAEQDDNGIYYQMINLNGQWHYFGMKLTNPDGYEVVLDYGEIISFELTDEILNWGHTAKLILRTEQNVSERRPDQNTEPSPEETEEKYSFRNDKRDTILIHIEPVPNEEGPSFPQSFTFDMEFVVTSRVQLPSEDVNLQYAVFTLEEMDIQQMFERSIEWSTATAKLNPYHDKEQTRMHDNERAMKTGLAIKDLLEETGREWDPDYWDDGITTMFYSSYGNASVGEIISYMLRKNLSEAKPHDICLFWKDRVTQKWRLWPLSKFCEKAGNDPELPGEWEMGHVYVQTNESDVDPKYFVSFAPQWMEDGDGERAVSNKSADAAQFVYSDANTLEADSLNAPLVLVGKDKRNIFYYDTTSMPDNVRDYINENYTAKKYVDGLHLSVPHNNAQNTLENKRIAWDNNMDMYQRRNSGILNRVWNRIMHSGCAQLTVKGCTMFSAGKFFGVQSKAFQDTKFDYKKYGTWFVLACKLLLRGQTMESIMTCVKPEAFRDIGLDDHVD